MADNKYAKELKFYRANNSGNGAASSFKTFLQEEGDYAGWTTFLTIAKQDPNSKDVKNGAKFLWKEGPIISLAQNDIGELLAVLNGLQKEAGYKGQIFHSSNGISKNLKFVIADNGSGYFLSISGQDSNKNKIGPFSHNLSWAEGEVLKIFLEESIRKIYQ